MLVILSVVEGPAFRFFPNHKYMGAPGPSHLGTWDIYRSSSSAQRSRRTCGCFCVFSQPQMSGCPILFASFAKRVGDHESRPGKTQPGAPCLDFETWESTNLNPPCPKASAALQVPEGG